MLKFTEFQIIAESKMTASGFVGNRHFEKYVKPYLSGAAKHSKQGTHIMASKHDDLNVGEQVTLHSHHIDDKGVHHVTVSRPGSRKKITVPISKLDKPGAQTENEGHKYEKHFFNRCRNIGLVPPGHNPAGSTAGTDVPFLNKKKGTIHKGRAIYNGEVKLNETAALGQGTIKFGKHPKTGKVGWHIPDELRDARPEYAKAIEERGILEYMNKHHPDPDAVETTASGRARSITMPHPDLSPAEAYLKDHDADVVHIGEGHGTYRVGSKDKTGFGLPRLKGKGKWTIRQKQEGNKRSRTVMFQIHGKHGLIRSPINLDRDDHLQDFAKHLGHS